MIHTRKFLFINVSVPTEHNIKTKEKGKLIMYTDLEIDVTRMWVVQAIIIVEILGASWCIAPNLKNYINKIR